MVNNCILVVDDQIRMRKLIKDFLIAKGYSILEDEEGKVITSVNDISIGQVVKTTLKDGKINLSVVSKEQKNGKE